MKRALVLFLAVLGLSWSFSALATATPSRPAPLADPQHVTVYVTKTGKKYHRGTCQHLRQSKIPMDLEDARKIYSPCSVCKPPQ